MTRKTSTPTPPSNSINYVSSKVPLFCEWNCVVGKCRDITEKFKVIIRYLKRVNIRCISKVKISDEERKSDIINQKGHE